MPIYEYTCGSCGKRFDFLARRPGERPEACPACGAKELKKAFSTFAADVKSSDGCACGGSCGHSHGPGCGCGCCG